MGDDMMKGGRLCIDLSNVEMKGRELAALVRAVHDTVVQHLAQHAKVATITMVPATPTNNGFDYPDPLPGPRPPPEPPSPPPPSPPPPPSEPESRSSRS